MEIQISHLWVIGVSKIYCSLFYILFLLFSHLGIKNYIKKVPSELDKKNSKDKPFYVLKIILKQIPFGHIINDCIIFGETYHIWALPWYYFSVKLPISLFVFIQFALF